MTALLKYYDCINDCSIREFFDIYMFYSSDTCILLVKLIDCIYVLSLIFVEEIDGGTVMVFDIEKLELRTTRGDSSFDTVKVPTPYLLTRYSGFFVTCMFNNLNSKSDCSIR